MIRHRSQIPLECYRVFRSAAQYLNFSAAARHLGITQAAVSQRIQRLEDLLEIPLFVRQGRVVTLTHHGAYLYRRLDTMFEFLDETLDTFDQDLRGGQVSIAASGSVSHFWLSQNLLEFSKRRPDISIRILTTDSMAQLASPSHDLVILYSKGEHLYWDLAPILPETLVPCATPDYLRRIGNPSLPMAIDEIARLDLLDYDKYNPLWVTLADWFEHNHFTAPRPRVVFSSYALTFDAAAQGQGVMLLSERLAMQPGRPGNLVPLTDRRLVTGYKYCLGRPRKKVLSSEASALHSFLLEQALAASS
ncbi:MAG: LysR family transcriptional regulator [Rhizobiaceae bacterium]|nr:LysR family transcriptional regulator [Rhizobiaceae bacterium]